MNTARKPVVAGMFYPEDAAVLYETVVGLLADAKGDDVPPKAIIAPHAGYVYSGQVAAQAYKAVEKVADTIRRVVLIGPSHRVAFEGMAVPSVDYFATPLGTVRICKRDVEVITSFPFVQELDAAHAQEHSLEVQVPFLQEILGENFELTPIVVGQASAEQVSAVLEALWGGTDTLVVISSDLSHYHDYDTASEMDKATSQAIVDKNGDIIVPEKACGSRGIKGLLHLSQRLGIDGHVVALCNSGDTAGDKNRVVGYGAYHFGRLTMDDMVVTPYHQEALRKLAYQSIAYGLEHGKPAENFDFSRQYFCKVPRASFVTLEIDGKLRGCIGSLVATRPLAVDVFYNAYQAAFNDSRFSPLTPKEFDQIKIYISVLSPSSKLSFTSENDLIAQLRPAEDGLILVDGDYRGTFLPSVWKSIPEAEDFVRRLKCKAGLNEDYWSDTLQVFRYTTQYF